MMRRPPKSPLFPYTPLSRSAEALHLDAAPREIDQRLQHDLAGSVVRDLPASVAAHDRNAAIHGDGGRALPQRVDGRMLKHPDLVFSGFASMEGEVAHRPQGWLVVHPAECLDADFFGDQAHSTMT